MVSVPDTEEITSALFGDDIAFYLGRYGYVKTVGELRAMSDEEVLRIPLIGRKRLKAIRDVIGPYQSKDRARGRVLNRHEDKISELFRFHQEMVMNVRGLQDRVEGMIMHYDRVARPTEWHQYRNKIGWKTHHWRGGDE